SSPHIDGAAAGYRSQCTILSLCLGKRWNRGIGSPSHRNPLEERPSHVTTEHIAKHHALALEQMDRSCGGLFSSISKYASVSIFAVPPHILLTLLQQAASSLKLVPTAHFISFLAKPLHLVSQNKRVFL